MSLNGTLPTLSVGAFHRRTEFHECGVVAVEPDEAGGEMERSELVGFEGEFRAGVFVTVEPVDVDGWFDPGYGLDSQGHAHGTQIVFVALERASEGGFRVGVAADSITKLFGSERDLGVEQCSGEVQQPFELVHQVPLPVTATQSTCRLVRLRP